MIEKIVLAVAALLVLVAIACLLWRRRQPGKLKVEYFQSKWQDLQKLLRNKEQWAATVVGADKLLDTALKKKRIRGRSMGERLVKAQRLFTDNDGVWFGHKLRNKIDADPKIKLKESDVKEALVGIRQGLKDLGALPQ